MSVLDVPLAPGPGRSARRRAVGLAAAALVLAFLGLAVAHGRDTVAAHDWRLQPSLVVAGVAALIAFYLAAAWAYCTIVEGLHPASPPRRAQAAIWARSLLGRYVPGSVLMVVGRVVLGREAGIPRRVTLAATVYEQVIGLAVAAAGGVLFLALYGASGGASLWLVALVPLVVLGLHPRVFGPIGDRALRRFGREPLTDHLSARAVALVAGRYALTNALLAVGVWALVRAAAGPSAGGPAFVGLAFLLAFTVSMVAVIFPSGLGVRDGIFALALAQNLPGEVAVAVSVGLRLALTAIELVVVGGLVIWARRGP